MRKSSRRLWIAMADNGGGMLGHGEAAMTMHILEKM
jgi:hypothetical protein